MRVELGVCEDDEHHSVGTEGQVVESDGGLRRSRVPESILRSNGGRIEEASCGSCIRNETNDVEQGKINRKSMCRTTFPIEKWLRIERCTPGKNTADDQLSCEF